MSYKLYTMTQLTVSYRVYSSLLSRQFLCANLKLKFYNSNRFNAYRGIITSVSSTSDYCRDLVKKYDFHNYLIGLLLPTQYRAGYFAIRSFNIEIATIKDQTKSNLIAAKVRFQWWKDIIEEIYTIKERNNKDNKNEPNKVTVTTSYSNQPVAQELAGIINNYNISRKWFDRSIDARQKDLISEIPESINDLEDYGENGHSSILYLLLEMMNIKDEKSFYAASHVGVSSGIVTLLRGHVFHTSNSTIYIPQNLMTKYNLTTKSILNGPNKTTSEQHDGIKKALFDIASQAYGHIDMANKILIKDDLNKQTIYCLLPAVSNSLYLRDFRIADCDPFNKSLLLEKSHLNYQIKLIQSIWTNKVLYD